MSITSKIASWNSADGEVYSIQHHVIKFVSDLQEVCRFLQVLQFPLQIKLTATYLTEILLKVALNTLTLTLTLQKYIYTPTVITILSDTPRISKDLAKLSAELNRFVLSLSS